LRLCFRKFPHAIQDFGTRAVEAHGIIPARHDRQAIGNLAVAAAELNGDRSVRILLRCYIVKRVRVVAVLLKVAFGVVDANRPKAINRNILYLDPVNGRAVVLVRCEAEISCILKLLLSIS
jgi:hypothetical protein